MFPEISKVSFYCEGKTNIDNVITNLSLCLKEFKATRINLLYLLFNTDREIFEMIDMHSDAKRELERGAKINEYLIEKFREIIEKRKNDAEFDALWQESRNEYKLLAELVKIRKESNLSQTELAEKSGNKQQVISRIENRENSPTLKTLCSILDVLGYEIRFEPKQKV